MSEPRPLAVVDLDGVVADVRHRLHHLQGRRKDWKAFFAAARDDDAHPEGVAIVRILAEDHEVVFLTGRPSHLHDDTLAWLDEHHLGGHRVLMRPEGDRRSAAVVKMELLRTMACDRSIGIVVDDDPVVLEAVRRAGYPTFAATWEERADQEEDALHEAQEADGRT